MDFLALKNKPQAFDGVQIHYRQGENALNEVRAFLWLKVGGAVPGPFHDVGLSLGMMRMGRLRSWFRPVGLRENDGLGRLGGVVGRVSNLLEVPRWIWAIECMLGRLYVGFGSVTNGEMLAKGGNPMAWFIRQRLRDSQGRSCIRLRCSRPMIGHPEIYDRQRCLSEEPPRDKKKDKKTGLARGWKKGSGRHGLIFEVRFGVAVVGKDDMRCDDGLGLCGWPWVGSGKYGVGQFGPTEL
ncbi:hypothetical protein Droror1_Dr00027512 [Drosera rotundifolia]